MFNPIDFLDFSKNLIDDKSINKNEAFYRSIISRSYYSALLTIREIIDNFNITILAHGGTPSHNDIIKKISKLPTTNVNFYQLRTLKLNLNELKIYRINADYKFSGAKHPKEKSFLWGGIGITKKPLNPETDKAARYVVKSAEKVIKQINKV